MRTDPTRTEQMLSDIEPVTYFHTRAEVADLFRCSEFTVKRWIADGRLRATRPTQRTVRISDVELQRFIRDNTRLG